MIPLFKDPEHQSQFEKDGFIKLSILSEADIRDLLLFYQSLNNNHITDYGFHVSIDNENPEFVRNVIGKIEQTLRDKLRSIFTDYQITTASFVVKEPNPASFVPPHQDWTFTDETKYASMTIWSPLQDVTKENGALAVLKGSHRLFPGFRASPSPVFQTVFGEQGMVLFPYMEIIPMLAGETLIFDNRLVHASPPNYSGSPRIAAGIGVMPEKAELYHYYLNPGNSSKQVSRYTIDREFFLHYNNARLLDLYRKGKTPETAGKTESIPYSPRYFSAEELRKKLTELPDLVSHPEMEKIAEVFSSMFSSYIDAKKTKHDPEDDINQQATQDSSEEDLQLPTRSTRNKGMWNRIKSIFTR